MSMEELLRDHHARLQEIQSAALEQTKQLAAINNLAIFHGALGKTLESVDPKLSRLLDQVFGEDSDVELGAV